MPITDLIFSRGFTQIFTDFFLNHYQNLRVIVHFLANLWLASVIKCLSKLKPAQIIYYAGFLFSTLFLFQ